MEEIIKKSDKISAGQNRLVFQIDYVSKIKYKAYLQATNPNPLPNHIFLLDNYLEHGLRLIQLGLGVIRLVLHCFY